MIHPSHGLARAIMGRNMLGVPEVSCLLGKTCLAGIPGLQEVPYCLQTLRQCKQSHILVADTGLSLAMLRRHSWVLKMKSVFEDEAFVTKHEPACWRLIARHPLVDSFGKSWNEQCALVDNDKETTLSARQIVYAVLLYEHTRRYKLLSQFCVRSHDVSLQLEPIVVGPFTEYRLRLDPWQRGDQHPHLGFMTARKPDLPKLLWTDA